MLTLRKSSSMLTSPLWLQSATQPLRGNTRGALSPALTPLVAAMTAHKTTNRQAMRTHIVPPSIVGPPLGLMTVGTL